MGQKVTGSWASLGRCAHGWGQGKDLITQVQVSGQLWSRNPAIKRTKHTDLCTCYTLCAPGCLHVAQNARNVFAAREFVWWYNAHPDAAKVRGSRGVAGCCKGR